MTRAAPGSLTRARDPALAAAPAAARAIVELARQRAAVITDEAQGLAAAECARARENGLAQGLEEGRQAGRREAAADLARIVAAVQARVAEDLAAWAAEVAPSLVHLALEIAESVIREVSDDDRHKAVQLATEALRTLGDDGRRRVRCHPRDVAELAGTLGVGFGDVEVVEDSSIDSPGCVIQGENGTVDGTIPTQMARVRSRLVAG